MPFTTREEIRDNTEIVVVPIDMDRYLDFVVAAHRETFRITFGSDITDAFLEDEIVRMRANAAKDRYSVAGAFINDKIAGLTVLETRNRIDSAQIGWIHFYYVSPSSRRMGVGLQLVKYSEAYFSALGLTEFCLRTGEYNQTAIDFYMSTGFTRVPEEDRRGLNGVNELMMRFGIGSKDHS